MTDLLPPPPVPHLTDTWISQRREALLEAMTEPRTRLPKFVALGGASAGVATAVTVALSVGGTAPNAFAGWSADPTSPAAGQLQSADAVCQARFAQAGPPTNRPAPAGQPSNQTVTGPLEPLLSDVRGPFTATVFGAGGGATAICLSTPDAVSLRWLTNPPEVPAPRTIAVGQVGYMVREGQPYTMVWGTTGTDVSRVTLTLDDGSTVTPTVGNGLFLAWWPGSNGVASASISSSSGPSVQPLDIPGPSVPQQQSPKPS